MSRNYDFRLIEDQETNPEILQLNKLQVDPNLFPLSDSEASLYTDHPAQFMCCYPFCIDYIHCLTAAFSFSLQSLVFCSPADTERDHSP